MGRWSDSGPVEREISVLEFLVPSGLAVSPTRLTAPGPHYHDGLWMTFTDWVPEVEPDTDIHPAVSIDDARELGRMLRCLHDARRRYDGELGGSRELRDDIERSREMYAKRVAPPVAARHDYFHQELVNTLAEGDSAKLGSGYPGASVAMN